MYFFDRCNRILLGMFDSPRIVPSQLDDGSKQHSIVRQRKGDDINNMQGKFTFASVNWKME